MRGTFLHRLLGLGVLSVVVTLAAASVAQAVGSPRPPLTGVHAALESKSTDTTPGQFGPVPDAFERAVLRSQAATPTGDSHERTATVAQTPYVPGFAIQPGQVPEISIGANGSQISDSNGRVDLPGATLASTAGDDTGIAWMDVVYGMLLGFALVALGGIAAFAVRSNGRVPQS